MPDPVPTTLAAILLLFALNGRLRARKIRVWQLGLLASEFGIFVAPVALALAVLSANAGLRGLLPLLLSLAAAGLLLGPEYASRRLGRGLEQRIKAGLSSGDTDATTHPHVPVPGFRASRETHGYIAPSGAARRIVFYPANHAGAAPCVVVVHSGGWESGSPEEFPGFHRQLAQAGYAVACIEYGLAPAHAWPVPRDDVRAAIARLRADAAKLRIDPERLVLFGRSAGGQIALCVAYDAPPPGVRGAIAFYAPTDMVFAWHGAYDGDILDSPRLLKNYLGGRPAETPAIHADASPTVLAARGPVLPTLLLHGRRDELVWCLQLRRLARVLRRHGTPHAAIILPWARHAFDYRTRGPGGRIAMRATAVFLEEVLRKQ